MSSVVFVDRDVELQELRRLYEMSVKGAICGVILYGWRKVGKSMLVDRFLEEVRGFRINCAWISDPETFCLVVIDKLRGLLGDHEIIDYLRFLLYEEENPMVLLKKTFDVLNSMADIVGEKPVVALDEVHKFIDKMATRISRELRKSKEVVYNDILWMLKGIFEEKKVFWILLSSIGWVKLREVLEIKKVKENPLLGLLVRFEVKPFDLEATKQLVKARRLNLPAGLIMEIHRVSGGIPLIVDMLCLSYDGRGNIIEIAIDLVRRGVLDEFFENMVKFVAEVMKRDYTILIKILKAFEDDQTSPELAARNAKMDRTSTYILLEDLHKCGILGKEKHGKEVKYRILYPLLKTWLDLRAEPRKSIFDITVSQLGITAGYYVQELLRKYEGTELALWDDKKGTFLLGTAREVRYSIKRVYSIDETAELLGPINADLIVELESDEYLLVEVKAGARDIETADVVKLDEIRTKFGRKIGKKVHAIMILMGVGKATLPAITEAVTRGIAIITREGIKLLAKKVKMLHY